MVPEYTGPKQWQIEFDVSVSEATLADSTDGYGRTQTQLVIPHGDDVRQIVALSSGKRVGHRRLVIVARGGQSGLFIFVQENRDGSGITVIRTKDRMTAPVFDGVAECVDKILPAQAEQGLCAAIRVISIGAFRHAIGDFMAQ